jgi:hypothetical protein
MIEEDEWSDHAPIDVRQRPADCEMSDVDTSGHDHEIDCIGCPLVARRRILAGEEAHDSHSSYRSLRPGRKQVRCFTV